MSKEKNKTPDFPAEIIDKHDRHERYKRIEDYAKELPEKLEMLTSEGLINGKDIEEVQRIAAMDEAAYVEYVRGLFKTYLSRIGFCPTEERRRIADNFNAMMERTAGAVACLHGFVEGNYSFVADDAGQITPDVEAAKKEADRVTTTTIDTAALAEYYKRWEKVAQAWEQLNAYEKQQGIESTNISKPIQFVRHEMGITALAEYRPASIIANFDKEETKDIFFQAFARRFAR